MTSESDGGGRSYVGTDVVPEDLPGALAVAHKLLTELLVFVQQRFELLMIEREEKERENQWERDGAANSGGRV